MKTRNRRLEIIGFGLTSAGSWAWLIVILVSAAWATLLIWLEIQKFLAFRLGGDMGIYVQAMWSTAHGRPFYMSLLGGPGNFLGHHFAPLMVVLAPFYHLWPDARFLLVTEVAALALTIVPLYIFARKRLGPKTALLIILAFLLYPPLHFTALTDFHEIHLAIPLLMASAVALVDKRLRLSIACLALAMLAKEEVVFIAIGFGVYIALVHRRWRLGVTVATAATLWGLLLFLVIIPSLNGGTNYTFYNRYATLGDTPRQMLDTLIFQPITVLRLISTPSKLLFVFQLLAPLVGLPLLGFPPILLALPTLTYLLLSDYGFMTSITFYYTAPLIPFLFVATVVALQRVRGRQLRAYQASLIALVLVGLISARLWSPLPGGRAYVADTFKVTEADRAAGTVLATIPPDASVASYGEYAAWVANRFRMANIARPGGAEIWPSNATEYLAVQAPKPYSISAPVYPWVVQHQAGMPVRISRYTLIQKTDQGLTLWKWRGSEHDMILPRYDIAFEEGLNLVAAGTPPEGPAWGNTVRITAHDIVPIWIAWQAKQRLNERITFSIHLLDAQGSRVAQVDREMAEGHFPTTLWHTHEAEPTVADLFPLELPADIAPGQYRLLAGAFRTETVAALSRLDGGQWVELTRIEITP